MSKEHIKELSKLIELLEEKRRRFKNDNLSELEKAEDYSEVLSIAKIAEKILEDMVTEDSILLHIVERLYPKNYFKEDAKRIKFYKSSLKGIKKRSKAFAKKLQKDREK